MQKTIFKTCAKGVVIIMKKYYDKLKKLHLKLTDKINKTLLNIKLVTIECRIDSEYKNLGESVYKSVKGYSMTDNFAHEITTSVKKIESLNVKAARAIKSYEQIGT